MKSFLLFIQQINFSKVLDSCKPDLSKYPSGCFVHSGKLEWIPTTPNHFMEEITETELINLGFHTGDYPEIIYVLNEETSLVLVCSEGKWYGAIHQFQGLKPPMERVYIPKDIKTVHDVKLLIHALSENNI